MQAARFLARFQRATCFDTASLNLVTRLRLLGWFISTVEAEALAVLRAASSLVVTIPSASTLSPAKTTSLISTALLIIVKSVVELSGLLLRRLQGFLKVLVL